MSEQPPIGLRDLLEVMRQDTTRQLDRIERKLDLKADNDRVDRLDARLLRLEKGAAQRLDLDDLEARVLSRDSISSMIGEALQDADSRGWTTRERQLAIGGFLILVANLALGLLTLGPDLWG